MLENPVDETICSQRKYSVTNVCNAVNTIKKDQLSNLRTWYHFPNTFVFSGKKEIWENISNRNELATSAKAHHLCKFSLNSSSEVRIILHLNVMQNQEQQRDSPDLQFPTSHDRLVWWFRNGSMPSTDLRNSAPNLSWIILSDTGTPVTAPESRSDWSSLCPHVSEALITARLSSYQRTETARQCLSRRPAEVKSLPGSSANVLPSMLTTQIQLFLGLFPIRNNNNLK